jgi:hypothetical protein
LRQTASRELDVLHLPQRGSSEVIRAGAAIGGEAFADGSPLDGENGGRAGVDGWRPDRRDDHSFGHLAHASRVGAGERGLATELIRPLTSRPRSPRSTSVAIFAGRGTTRTDEAGAQRQVAWKKAQVREQLPDTRSSDEQL